MAYAMWGIVIGRALLVGSAAAAQSAQLRRKREARWLDERHVMDRLRKQFGR